MQCEMQREIDIALRYMREKKRGVRVGTETERGGGGERERERIITCAKAKNTKRGGQCKGTSETWVGKRLLQCKTQK